jgi:hypothetical protein
MMPNQSVFRVVRWLVLVLFFYACLKVSLNVVYQLFRDLYFFSQSVSYADVRNDAYDHAGYEFLSKLIKRYPDNETYPKLVYPAYDFGIRVLLDGLRYKPDESNTAFINVNTIFADSDVSINSIISASCRGQLCALEVKTGKERYVLTELGIVSSSPLRPKVGLVHPRFSIESSGTRPRDWLSFNPGGGYVHYFRFSLNDLSCSDAAVLLDEFIVSPQVFKISFLGAREDHRFLLIGHNKSAEQHCIVERDRSGKSYLGGNPPLFNGDRK